MMKKKLERLVEQERERERDEGETKSDRRLGGK